MYADIAAITKHHLVGLLRVGRSTHVTNHIFIVFDAQTFLALQDRLDLVPAAQLEVNIGSLIPRLPLCLVHQLTSSSSTTRSNCSSVTGARPDRARSPFDTRSHASSHWSRSYAHDASAMAGVLDR